MASMRSNSCWPAIGADHIAQQAAQVADIGVLRNSVHDFSADARTLPHGIAGASRHNCTYPFGAGSPGQGDAAMRRVAIACLLLLSLALATMRPTVLPSADIDHRHLEHGMAGLAGHRPCGTPGLPHGHRAALPCDVARRAFARQRRLSRLALVREAPRCRIIAFQEVESAALPRSDLPRLPHLHHAGRRAAACGLRRAAGPGASLRATGGRRCPWAARSAPA